MYFTVSSWEQKRYAAMQRGAQAGLLKQNGGGTSIGFTADLHIALLGIGKHLIFLGQAKIGMIAHVRG